MVDFILRKWKYLGKDFRPYRDGYKSFKDNMCTYFKHKRGRMELAIPEVKAKKEIYGKKKGSAGNGPIDLKKVCLMWGVKKFFSPIGEGEDKETMAVHEECLHHQSELSIEKQDKLVVKILLNLIYP